MRIIFPFKELYTLDYTLLSKKSYYALGKKPSILRSSTVRVDNTQSAALPGEGGLVYNSIYILPTSLTIFLTIKTISLCSVHKLRRLFNFRFQEKDIIAVPKEKICRALLV